jgi:hypothetical protein
MRREVGNWRELAGEVGAATSRSVVEGAIARVDVDDSEVGGCGRGRKET